MYVCDNGMKIMICKCPRQLRQSDWMKHDHVPVLTGSKICTQQVCVSRGLSQWECTSLYCVTQTHSLLVKFHPISNDHTYMCSLFPLTLLNQSTACFDCWPKCAHRGIFDCHFDHPEQYQTMLLPVKNSPLILPVNVLNTYMFDSVWLLSALDRPWEVCQHFDWFWPFHASSPRQCVTCSVCPSNISDMNLKRSIQKFYIMSIDVCITVRQTANNGTGRCCLKPLDNIGKTEKQKCSHIDT